MLEQELYNQEINSNDQPVQPAPVAPAPDLFRNYEIRHWDFSPTFYKILAASAIFNVAALVVFAQSNVLMTRGCDSPLVSKFCQVLDTVYVGSVLLGTDAEFASRDYEKTELEDADITYIDVSGQTPPLNYPEGYFALANPEEFAMRQQQAELIASGDTSGFTMPPSGSIPFPSTPNPTGDLMNTMPTLPPQNNNPVVGRTSDFSARHESDWQRLEKFSDAQISSAESAPDAEDEKRFACKTTGFRQGNRKG
jgi:hypothetical protein